MSQVNFLWNRPMKGVLLSVITVVMAILCSSCQKEADYVLHVGEYFCMSLIENRPSNMCWEWEDADKTEVVSMEKILYYADADSSHCLVHCWFEGEKKGFVMVNMVYAKGNPDFQRTIHFSIRVED